MPQTRKPASSPSPKGAKPATGDPAPIKADRARVHSDAGAIRQALEELGIDRPYMACRVVGNRLELTLYGGDVVFWPPKPAPQRRRGPAPRRKQGRSRRKTT